MKEENKVAQAVREAMLKAAKKGENVKAKVGEISREAVKSALERTELTRDAVIPRKTALPCE